jgi:prevent-host-death family protein
VKSSRVLVELADLRRHLERHLALARSGTEVIITDRGLPVARLSAVTEPDELLAELIATGPVPGAGAMRGVAISAPEDDLLSTGLSWDLP